jgi:tetratricopeptide (TPR) repeat protein
MKIKNRNTQKVLSCFILMNVIGFLNVFVILGASPVDSLISKGNRFYLDKKYDLAAKTYNQVITQGYESCELYYNLGNAYYKQDKNAEAILYYEKALVLKPGDDDIRQNLVMSNNRIIDKIDVIPEFFIVRWIKLFQGILTADQWAVLSLVLFLVALTGFALYIIGSNLLLRKAGFISGCSLMLISIMALLLMFGRMRRIESHNYAIIMESIVNARSSPDEQSTNVFILHAGTKVALVDSVQNWKYIRIANGNKGWVPGKTVKGI